MCVLVFAVAIPIVGTYLVGGLLFGQVVIVCVFVAGDTN